MFEIKKISHGVVGVEWTGFDGRQYRITYNGRDTRGTEWRPCTIPGAPAGFGGWYNLHSDPSFGWDQLPLEINREALRASLKTEFDKLGLLMYVRD